MIIASDITTVFPFKKKLNIVMKGKESFHSMEEAGDGEPLFTVELETNMVLHETQVKIQRRRRRSNGWYYETCFNGRMDSPKDLFMIFDRVGVIKTSKNK